MKYIDEGKFVEAIPEIKPSPRYKGYGITLEQYRDMLIAQRRCCAICGLEFENLCVDHNHKTNAIRGLLCQRCNQKLAVLESSQWWLDAAKAYLEKYRK